MKLPTPATSTQTFLQQLPYLTLSGILSICFCLTLGQGVHAGENQRVRWTPEGDRGQVGSTRSGGRRGQEISACGLEEDATSLSLLVPDNVTGLRTTSANPTFAWQVKTQSTTNMQFLIMDITEASPLYSETVEIDKSGIVSVRLPEDITLEMGTRYRWTVISDCANGTQQEIFARSFIERRDGESLDQQLHEQSHLDQALVYAENGFWYNALEQLLFAHGQEPDNETVAEALDSLLLQGMGEDTDVQFTTLNTQTE